MESLSTKNRNSLSSQAMSIWAKSDRDTQDGSWNPLIAHMLDTAACAEAILELEPESTKKLYISDFGFETWEETKIWVLALIGMHDLGKASPTFQNMWRQGADWVEQNGLSFFTSLKFPLNSKESGGKYEGLGFEHHGYISQMSLKKLLIAKNWSSDAANFAADAVGAHHGWRAVPSVKDHIKKNINATGGEQWIAIRAELFEAMLNTLNANTELPPKIDMLSPGAYMRLAGLTSFTDWIASNISYFPFRAELSDLSVYYQTRFALAKDSLKKLGWIKRNPLIKESCSFESLFFNSPRPLQQVVERLSSQVSKPVLMLLEAPMGEGKTEAAFYAHAILQRQLGHRGLYVALPTQATGNAMFKRLLEFLKQIGKEDGIDLQLAHGAAMLNADYQEMRRVEIFEGETLAESEAASVRAAEWFTNKKRALLSEYGVGTVDQALLGILKVKHYFVRLWGLGNRTIVLDEVHAYDTYTSTLIERLVKWLHAMDASVIVMTATLPASRRNALLKAYGASSTSIPKISYPRVYKVCDGNIDAEHFPADPERQLTLEIRAIEEDISRIANKAIELVSGGGCLGCIMNTVQRAQDLYREIQKQQSDIELYLFHARYPAQERQVREDLVLSKFGLKGDRPYKAILIATQVVEQSLDLDFDVMISDLAPIDLILQRAGREHRHKGRERFQHQQAVFYISGLKLEHSCVPHWGEPLYWDVIYDKEVLLCTQWYLQDKQTLHLPTDIDPCIQKVYDEPLELPDWLINTEEKAANKSLIARSLERKIAKDAMIGEPDNYDWEDPPQIEKLDPDDNPDVYQGFWAKTRLGDEPVCVIPLHEVSGKFTLIHQPDFEIHPQMKLTLEISKSLYMQHVKLSRKDIVKFFKSECQDSPDQAVIHDFRAIWEKDPLLKNCYPLLLRDSKVQIGKLLIEHHSELGIVYHKISTSVGES